MRVSYRIMHRRFIINEVLHIFAECGAVTYCRDDTYCVAVSVLLRKY